jgi:hypothetical protein
MQKVAPSCQNDFTGDTFVRVTAIRTNAYESANGELLRTV